MSTNSYKDFIDQFHDKGVFIPESIVRLSGVVDIDMFNQFSSNIMALDYKNNIINILLLSEGGDLTICRAIYDLIRSCSNKVVITCYGEACSSATLIMQAADERVIMYNSKIIIHVGSEGISTDHPRNVDKVYNEHRKDEEWIENIYLNRIKEKKKRFTRSQLKSLLQWDKYLSPKEALDLGLIDRIK